MLQKHIQHRVKEFLGRGYHAGKHFLGQVDHAYRTARNIYSIARPALEHFAPETKKVLDKNLSKAATEYEEVRHKIVDTHDKISKHLKKNKVL